MLMTVNFPEFSDWPKIIVIYTRAKIKDGQQPGSQKCTDDGYLVKKVIIIAWKK